METVCTKDLLYQIYQIEVAVLDVNFKYQTWLYLVRHYKYWMEYIQVVIATNIVTPKTTFTVFAVPCSYDLFQLKGKQLEKLCKMS